ncbi:MAG TPA: methyltransferase domain-containing protein [Candidatus Acidoferrales bacterium]
MIPTGSISFPDKVAPVSIKERLKDAMFRSLVPRKLSRNHRRLSASDRSDLRNTLRRHYFNQPLNYFSATPDEYLESEEGQKDMAAHLERRTATDRQIVIPWLDSVCQLQGCRVLEIGCGTGASTIALAEQGCDVTAIDVNEGNLLAAEERCRIYGLNAKFLCANATELQNHFSSGMFDLIVFFATLEHLSYAERMLAMKETWAMLKPGCLWGVVETPNRLWWFDDHTAGLAFFNWLPDDLALDYAPHSDRASVKKYANAKHDEETKLDFARRGRGVSYHEFDLALGPSGSLQVVSALSSYLRRRNIAIRLKRRFSAAGSYEAFLKRQGPRIHPGFYQPSLDLIIRK